MVEKAEADLQKRVAETQDWFREAHKELKAAQGELAKRDLELTMKLADVEKAQETARNLAGRRSYPDPARGRAELPGGGPHRTRGEACRHASRQGCRGGEACLAADQ